MSEEHIPKNFHYDSHIKTKDDLLEAQAFKREQDMLKFNKWNINVRDYMVYYGCQKDIYLRSLIAGLIDGDGSIHCCNFQERKPYYYQISQHIRSSASHQNYDIMLFIQHLARSVGLGLTWTIRRVQL